MHNDICGIETGLFDADAREAWNKTVLGFLAHSNVTPTHLGALLEKAPEFAMGHAAKGLFCLMLGRAEMIPAAARSLAAARTGHANTERERLWVKALAEWLDGRPSGAIAAMEAALRLNPADTASAKISQAIRFILGDAHGMRRSAEALMDAHGPDHACRGYLMGCLAFALEETGDYDDAEAMGRNALKYAPDDAWGLHAVAHVYDMTARPDLGIALIDTHEPAWSHCNNFRYHVWWHKALLHLDRGEMDLALALYDQQIRIDKTDDYRDISNATSLLMRLELEGINVGNRWEELADFSENRTQDGCLVFADLHYMLALGAAGRTGASAEMALRYTAEARQSGEMAARVADPGVCALTGLVSFSEGHYDTAFLNLSKAREAMQTIGGSHAQRDVFERMAIDAGLRAGHLDGVEHVLGERIARRAGTHDRFSATRLDMLAHARRIPAQ